ncbi:cobalamin biosynthesis protein CbiL [Ancylobacter sp.]|uniref:cobalamin biosynthesis protein CbiL n=1 Tax=Ancylobacter sp. TaxID=1872567 RepID=UPI003D0DB88F
MIRFLLPLLLALAFSGPAQAHKLKVFATVEGGSVKGYAFFIGGGRAAQAPWIAEDGAGARLAEGATDGEGRFAFDVPPPPSDVTVTVDTREGHIASASLLAARFAGAPGNTVSSPSAASGHAVAVAAPAGGPGGQSEQLAALVEAAVQRQVEPLMEQIEQLDSRLRLADVMSGVFLILGLAGMGMWARSRRA